MLFFSGAQRGMTHIIVLLFGMNTLPLTSFTYSLPIAGGNQSPEHVKKRFFFPDIWDPTLSMGRTLQASDTLDGDSLLIAEDTGSCLPRLPLYLGYTEGCVSTIPVANPSDVNTQTPNSAQPSTQMPKLDSVPIIWDFDPSSQPGNDLGPPNSKDIHALPGSPEAPSKPPEIPSSSQDPPPNSPGAPSGSAVVPWTGSIVMPPAGKPTQGSQNVIIPWSNKSPTFDDGVSGSTIWNNNWYNRNQREKYDLIRQDAERHR